MSDSNFTADELLRRDVRLLGELLGDTIRQRHSKSLFDLVEQVRAIAKQATNGEPKAVNKLIKTLSKLSADELLHLARAFTLFLNLANIAEQHHQIRQRRAQLRSDIANHDARGGFLYGELKKLKTRGIKNADLSASIAKLNIDLVLTAHPTEVIRGSVAAKFLRIARLLAEQDRADLNSAERAEIKNRLHRAIAEVWATDEIRRQRPTPLDEAKSNLITVEHTLWDTLPKVVRELNNATAAITNKKLPPRSIPIRFSSWMGGDRDGNPNITAQVTRGVCLLNKLKAARMFLTDINKLKHDLSMRDCSTELRNAVGTATTPYRALLNTVEARLQTSVDFYAREYEAYSNDPTPLKNKITSADIYQHTDELRAPLKLCYDSLQECGEGLIADGKLTDTLRRLDAFGLTLLKLDIRQEAARHTEALDAITQFLNLGSYASWDEAKRQEFLITELNNKRPLIASTFPAAGQTSDSVAEVLATFRMIAHENPESFGAYVISMASQPSDVLAVALLQKECRVLQPLPVVPLFERVAALKNAAKCMHRLFSIDWYKKYINGHQQVMLGYSDSAKDAGMLSAAWNLYQAQDKLVKIFAQHKIELTLFHGRGGTVARGGGPAYQAIRSQPPGAVNCSMRVTEQGEVIQAKYGLPGTAEETLQVYIGAILEATLTPPPEPNKKWIKQIEKLSNDAMQEFHSITREHSDFIDYFRLATPQGELGDLKIGSRPARRVHGHDIQGLRAIPWIFAWTQTRLMLPAWLGVGAALLNARARGEQNNLLDMQNGWPFFQATLNSIEMVFSKGDANMQSVYDARLVTDKLQPFGATLRDKYKDTLESLLAVTGNEVPLQQEPIVRRSVQVRNAYVMPLNILQVELLDRVRKDTPQKIKDALLIAINGIAAGMRNTG